MILLTDARDITGDLSDDFIGGIKHFPGLGFHSILSCKPSVNILPSSPHILIDFFFSYFHIHAWNRLFVGRYCFQNLLHQFRRNLTQILFNSCHMNLQTLDKRTKIFDQTILKYQKFFCLHHFFCLDTVQFPHIILIILIQTDKITVQITPPSINGFSGFFADFLHPGKTHTKPFQKRGLQGRTFDEQILQPHHHTLYFHCRFRQLITEFFVFKLFNRGHFSCILNGRQISPVHKGTQILLTLFRRIFGKMRIFPQLLINLFLIHPVP